MRANRHARTLLGSLWCPELPPAFEAGIHNNVRFDMQRAGTSMAETHAEGRVGRSQCSFMDKKAFNWLRCNRWVRLIDTDKNLDTALVESPWIEDQVQLWLSKMTRRISEVEASQNITA